jgi:hypothetical protein
MPQLTRRRDPNSTQETWGVYYGDGALAIRPVVPGGSGRATSIQVAIHQNTQKAPRRPSTRRAVPSRSRGVSFTPSVTEADFDAYRRNPAWRQAIGGCKPHAADSSCRRPAVRFCGASISVDDLERHTYTKHIEHTAA